MAWVRVEGPAGVSHATLTDASSLSSIVGGGPLAESVRTARARAQEEWMAGFRASMGPQWDRLSDGEKIVELALRVGAGEWLGQANEGVIYAQEAARFLGLPNPDAMDGSNPVWVIISDLVAREELDMNGSILSQYVAGFRFPDELRHLLAYIVEEPLGWPNGDAGNIAVSALERAIGDNTGYKHGRDLVWSHNYPHLSSQIMLQFGFSWLSGFVRHVASGDTADLDARQLKEISARLADLAEQLRSALG